MSKSNDPNSYVGDHFTLNFLRGDDNPLKQYNNTRVRLLGFHKSVKAIFAHEVNALVTEPGFYETLGDPLVKLENGKNVAVAMLNLVPEDYRFSDNLPKNDLYIREKRIYRFVAPLPHIPYNIGDTVLIGGRRGYELDFISLVHDIRFMQAGIYFTVENASEIVNIKMERIIDVIEHGELSELDRLGLLLKRSENLLERRISRFRYSDDENSYPPEDE